MLKAGLIAGIIGGMIGWVPWIWISQRKAIYDALFWKVVLVVVPLFFTGTGFLAVQIGERSTYTAAEALLAGALAGTVSGYLSVLPGLSLLVAQVAAGDVACRYSVMDYIRSGTLWPSLGVALVLALVPAVIFAIFGAVGGVLGYMF